MGAPKSLQIVIAVMKFLLLGRIVMTNFDSILTSRDITLPTKVHVVKAIYCHPAYLIYKQSTSCKMLGWMKHKLESRVLEEISIASDIQMTPPYGRK